MEALIKRLKEIKANVLELKQQLAVSKSELDKKDKEISRLKQLVDIQNSSIKDMEQKLKMKRLADELSEEPAEESGSNRDLKFKINEIIKEVDKIMNLMHQ